MADGAAGEAVGNEGDEFLAPTGGTIEFLAPTGFGQSLAALSSSVSSSLLYPILNL